MRLKAYLRLIIIVVAPIISSQCTVPSKMVSNDSNVADTSKTMTVSYVNRDSAQWEMNYAKFLDSIQPVNRTYEKIFPVLQSNKDIIFEALKPFLPNDSTLNKFIFLKITSQGKILKLHDSLIAIPDTQIVINANLLMDKVDFGNSQTGLYHTGINIFFDNNRQLFMDKKIVYGQGFGRSRMSVQHNIMTQMAELRYAYNKFIRNHPNAQGKLTIQFNVNSYGNIISCKVLSSTSGIKGFETDAIKVICKWKFDLVYTRDDVTRCVYPFVFSN
jgi:TonB family protein